MQALSIRNLSSLKTQVKFPKTLTAATVAALATLAFVMLVSALPALAQVNGAIYTTTSTGTTVNGNLYDAKTGVYLNGGPQNSKDAGLVPDGSYYFQVTDPSGAVLLSADDVSCRQVVVSNGRIVSVPAKTQAACKSGFHLLGTYNASNGEQVTGDLAAALVLREQYLGKFSCFSAAFVHYGEDVLLFQHLLVIVLAEIAKQDSSAVQRAGIQRAGVGSYFGNALRVHQQCATKHAVLAHQVFGCRDLRLLRFRAGHKQGWGNDRRSSNGGGSGDQFTPGERLGA
jgi:hypothetical protein